MSYEGRIQRICDNGHYTIIDEPYEFITGVHAKCSCNAKIVWENSVDDTNCDAVGYVDMSTYKIAEEKLHTCSCGHTHIVEKAKYRIPSDVGRRR